MDRISKVKLSLQAGQFSIFRKDFGLYVNVNQDNVESVIKLDSNNNTKLSVFRTIKYYTECAGLMYLNNSCSISIRDELAKMVTDNYVTLKLPTESGSLIVKKLPHSISMRSLNMLSSMHESRIMGRMFGYLNIVDDPHYKYGVIIEKYSPVTEIDFEHVTNGIRALKHFHDRFGLLHGDCNPDNIMQSRDGLLRLIDPGNILCGRVDFINRTFYDEVTPHSEYRAFFKSCLVIYAKLTNCELVDNIYINENDKFEVGSSKTGMNVVDNMDYLISVCTSDNLQVSLNGMRNRVKALALDDVFSDDEYLPDDRHYSDDDSDAH